MAKILENEYQGSEPLTSDQIRLALSGDYEGFKYFFENCLLIQDRKGKTIDGGFIKEQDGQNT